MAASTGAGANPSSQAEAAFVPLAGQLAQRLRELREARRWSFRRLERETGIPKSVLDRYEKAPEPNPPLDHLIELQRAFELLSLEELFGEVEISYPTHRVLSRYGRRQS